VGWTLRSPACKRLGPLPLGLYAPGGAVTGGSGRAVCLARRGATTRDPLPTSPGRPAANRKEAKIKIQNEIEVSAPPDELFDVLADVERVAPLVPGANLEGKEDDDTYAGTVKVKVGPITTSYRGTLRFVELDREGHRAVMSASADEAHGQGNLEAKITASVSGSDWQSVLSLETDLDVRGRAAQFGRGVLANVSQKVLDQFARNLESEVLSSGEKGEEPTTSEETGCSTGRGRILRRALGRRAADAAPGRARRRGACPGALDR
jgi:carbon monoxide dehydrogenase subunit G